MTKSKEVRFRPRRLDATMTGTTSSLFSNLSKLISDWSVKGFLDSFVANQLLGSYIEMTEALAIFFGEGFSEPEKNSELVFLDDAPYQDALGNSPQKTVIFPKKLFWSEDLSDFLWDLAVALINVQAGEQFDRQFLGLGKKSPRSARTQKLTREEYFYFLRQRAQLKRKQQ